MARPAKRHRPLLRIGELARRTGVGRGTIAHYLREGLLPAPEKSHRNMAYYAASCVERINLIKELQTRRRLSLAAIRELLGESHGGDAVARALIAAQQAALDALQPARDFAPMSRDAAATAFGLRSETIDDLERLGLVAIRSIDGDDVFAGADLEVLASIAHLSAVGLDERSGFSARDLTIYHEQLRGLLRREIETFVRVTTAGDMTGDLPQLARSAVDAASLLIVALRRKLIADMLQDPEAITELLAAVTRPKS